MKTVGELLAARPELRAFVDALINNGTPADLVLQAAAALPRSSGVTPGRPVTVVTPHQAAWPAAPPPVSPVTAAASWDAVVGELNAQLQADHPGGTAKSLRPTVALHSAPTALPPRIVSASAATSWDETVNALNAQLQADHPVTAKKKKLRAA